MSEQESLQREFEAAQTASPEDQSALRREFAMAKGVDKYDPQTRTAPYLLNEAKKAVSGAYSMLGLPTAVASIPQNAFRIAAGMPMLDPLHVVNEMRRQAESVTGVRDIKPSGLAQEVAGDITQFAVTGTPLAGAAMRGATAAQKLSILGSELLQDILGGVGTTAGRNVAGEPGALVGGLVGGASSTVVPALIRKATEIAKPFFNTEANRVWQYGRAGRQVEDAVNSHIGAADELAKSAQTVSQVHRIGGEEFNPSLQARTGSAAVWTIEHAANVSTPERLEKALNNYEKSLAALEKARSSTFPTTATGEQVVSSVRARIASIEKDVENSVAAIGNAQERIAASVTGDTAQVAGKKLESLFNDKLKAMRLIRDGKYNDVYKIAETEGLKMDMKPYLDVALGIKKDAPNIFQKMPETFQRMVNRYADDTAQLTGRAIPPDLMAAAGMGKKDTNVDFGEFHSLWRALGDNARSAASRGDMEVAAFAGKVRSGMEQEMVALQESGNQTAKALKDANTWYSTKFAPAFREGVGGQLATPGRWGERIAQEKMIDRFLTPSGMDDYFAIYGSGKDANKALHDGVLGLFASDKGVTKTGILSNEAGKAFYAAHKEALDKIPATRDVILDAGRRADELYANAIAAQQRLKEQDVATLQKLVSGNSPDAFFVGKLSSGKIDDLAFLMNNLPSNKRDAVGRLVADNLESAASALKLTPSEYVLKFGDKLKPLMDSLGRDHFRNLKIIASGETLLSRQAVIPRQAEMKVNIDPLEALTGTTASQAATTMRSIGMRHASETWLAQSFLFRLWNNRTSAERLEAIHKATLDPEFADALAKGMRSKATPGVLKEIQANALRLGIKSFAAQESTNEE